MCCLLTETCKDTFTYYDNLCIEDIAVYDISAEEVYEYKYVSEIACEKVYKWQMTFIFVVSIKRFAKL